jgi:hypothetical protein
MMKVSETYPAFKDGFIVIDVRKAPTLRQAIGARIFRTRKAADVFAQRVKQQRVRLEAQHVHVVPVEGPTDVFALDYIDATGVIVDRVGAIRIAHGRKAGA